MSKPDVGYGFVECSVDDPKRTHFRCDCEKPPKWLHVGISECSSGANHWRKPVEIPEGWELVPEGEELSYGSYKSDINGNFLTHTIGERFGKTAGQAVSDWNKNYPNDNKRAFIRRKSAATANEWVSVKDRLPDDSVPWVLVLRANPESISSFHNNGLGWNRLERNEVKFWCLPVLPPIPADLKTPAELAYEQDCKETGYSLFNEARKSGFLAGYSAGKASK